jgi:CHASE3 domain sensor protein
MLRADVKEGAADVQLLSNLTIRAKLTSAFAVLLLVTAVLGGVGLQRLSSVNHVAKEIRDK